MPRIDIPEGKADPEVRVWALRPEMGIGAGALSHAIYDESIVPVRERELARMRIAQINGCAICQQWRSTPGAEGQVSSQAQAAGADGDKSRTADGAPEAVAVVSESDYAAVADWQGYDGYSERERLVIDYAERFALDHHAIDDDFFDRLRAAYSDAEVLDLTVCIGGWLALGRTLHILGLDEHCRLPG